MVVVVTFDCSVMAVVTVGCLVEFDGSCRWMPAVLLTALKYLATSWARLAISPLMD